MNFAAKLIIKLFTASDARRDAGLTIPEDVEYIRDIAYGPGPEHTLHLAFPKGASASLPTVVSVHGGGYVYGSAELYRFYCADLAARGCAVVNCNYRLAPGAIFPAPVEDLNAVLEWLVDNVADWPVDTRNIFLVGDSAGAQIASQYAVIATNPDYARVMGITPPDVALRALGLNCGTYDISKNTRVSGIRRLFNDYFTADRARFGEKLRVPDYITERFPPSYLMSSGGDFFLGECAPMAELLRSRGVTAECKIYGDKKTGHVFHLDVRNPIGRRANDEELAFLMKYYNP